MQIGVGFPRHESGIGTDVAAVREYAQTAESLGHSHLRTEDHVLGAMSPVARGGRAPTITSIYGMRL